MEEVAARWRFLAPWCSLLRGRVTLDLRGTSRRVSNSHCRVRNSRSSVRARVAWLSVALPPDGKGDNWRLVTQLREALELLVALAAVDGAAFRALLVQHCGVSDDDAIAPRFHLSFRQYATLDISWGATLFHQFFLALTYETLSDAFRDAMMQVRQQQQQQLVTQSPEEMKMQRVMVEIAFAPPELPSHWSLPYLKSVLEVVQAIRDEADASDAFPFALQAVRLNVNHIKLSKKTLPVLTDLLELGVTIPLLSLHGSTAIAKASRNYMGQFITAVTRCASRDDASVDEDGSSEPTQVDGKSLRLRGPGVDSHQFGAFCSALATARGIESVQLSEIFTEERGYQRHIKWQWAAYAFFWRESSRSSISSLHIDDTSLREEDVMALASVVRAKHPAKALLRVDTSDLERSDASGDEAEEEEGGDPTLERHGAAENLDIAKEQQQAVSVLLSKGTRIHIDPYDPFDRRSFDLSADDHFLVMKDVPSSDYVEILVPGYAHCAVSRDLVQYYLCSSEEEAPSTGSVSRSGVTSLHLEFKHVVAASTLQAFVELVGSPLETLILKARALSSETLGVILRTCSQLKRLSLDVVEEKALEVLTRSYETLGCKISSLSLQGLELESEEVSSFADTLGSKDSALSKTLEELVIGERLESYALDEANLFALLSMLETNSKIEYLELFVENALYDNFLPLFTEFHGQELPVVKEHIPLTCRLAFLSVLAGTMRLSEPCDRIEDLDAEQRASKRPRRHSSGSSFAADTSRLDRHVISLIFHFAAIPRQRVVKLVKFH